MSADAERRQPRPLADMHAHYPMHVAAGEDAPTRTLDAMRKIRRKPWRDKLRALVLRIASRLANKRSWWTDDNRVTVETMQAGDARLACSVLYSPFEEIDFDHLYGAAPDDDYFDELRKQMRAVEADVVAQGPDKIRVVTDRHGLDEAQAVQAIALVHCVEGGFHLGRTPEKVAQNVETLARCGVVYITLAHLFWRQFATNANALPFLPDWLYKLLFRQPGHVGLTDRGEAAVRAMADHGVMVDVAHMDRKAMEATFAVLDEVAPDMPVIASHAGYRFGGQDYMLDRRAIERIAARDGVVGLIMAQHQLNDGLRRRRTKTLDESFDVICRHIDRIREITGSHRYTALGTDFDGFIKPTMGGLESMADLATLADKLYERYGDEDGARIASANAERVIRALMARREGARGDAPGSGSAAASRPS